MRTKENMRQHEFIGLPVEIVESLDKNQIGIHGKIVDETKNMFRIETNGTEIQIPKQGRIFRFEVNCEKIDVDGDEISFRPEDRIKKCDSKQKKKRG